jgi:hypothetical protein
MKWLSMLRNRRNVQATSDGCGDATAQLSRQSARALSTTVSRALYHCRRRPLYLLR